MALLNVRELAVVTRDRHRVLLHVLPFVSAGCGGAAWVIVNGRGAHPHDGDVFCVGGMLLLVLWMLLRRRVVGYWPAAAITLAVGGGLLAWRMLSVFTGAYFDDPSRSLLNPTFAYFPAYFTLLTLLLPYPRSARWGWIACLGVAIATTSLSARFWLEAPAREGLHALLALVWFGYPVIMLLVAGAARRYTHMIGLYADEAAAADAANRRAQESASRFRGIFDQAAIGIALTSADGRWLQVNPRVCEITGYGAEELLATNYQGITHPDDQAGDCVLVARLLRGELKTCARDKRFVRKDGSIVWVHIAVSLVAGREGNVYFAAALEDVSQRKAAEAQLAALHGQLEQRIEQRTRELRASNDRWQEQNARLQLVTQLSRRLASAPAEADARAIAAQLLPRIFEGSSGAVYLAGADGEYAAAFGWGDSWRARIAPVVATRPDNPARPMARVPMIAGGHVIGLLCVDARATADDPMLATVAEQVALAIANVRLRGELEFQATRDTLTGLRNRRYLNEFLPRSITIAQRSSAPLSLLVLDVDHFKRFNDLHGHEAGDTVLAAVAAAIAGNLREGDVAFRHGGEEFVAVLPAADTPEAIACAERIRTAVSTLAVTTRAGALPRITLSVGVSTLSPDGATMDQLLGVADAALYRAKHDGRNCVRGGMRRAA